MTTNPPDRLDRFERMSDRPSILKPNESYSFSQYFDLPFTLEDILAELNCTTERKKLLFSESSAPVNVQDLRRNLDRALRHVSLNNESSRREAIVFPILLEVCEITDNRLNLEYAVVVNEFLKGVIDYYIAAQRNLLVVEAKQADLERGFTQLAVELIAIDRWTKSTAPLLYGVVTDGERWNFGIYDRTARHVIRDTSVYSVPADLEKLVSVLIEILSPSP